MTTIPDDVPVPRFEDRLWAELARLHADASAPDPTGTPPDRPRLRARPRPGRRTMLAGVGIAATAAAVLAAVTLTRPGTVDDPVAETAGAEGPAGAPEPPVSIETRIVTATDTALADSIVHVVQDMTSGPGDSETWSDEQSGRMRSLLLDESGEPVFDSGPAVPPALDEVGPGMPPPGTPPFDPSLPSALHRQVDHCFGEYQEFSRALLPGGSEAARIRDRLEDGSMIEDGIQVVDGRELIRLVEGEPVLTGPQQQRADMIEEIEGSVGDGSAGTEDEGYVTLVDPETYRPVMVLGYPGSSAEYVMTFEYLPRTVENLALLSPPVPAGFTPATETRGDGERADRCGG